MGCGTSQPAVAIPADEKVRPRRVPTQVPAQAPQAPQAPKAPAPKPTVQEVPKAPVPLPKDDTKPRASLEVPDAEIAEYLVDEISGKWRKGKQITDVYKLGKVLGRGGFATVRIGTHLQTGDSYAIKIMTMPKKGAKETHNDNTWKDVMAEIAVLARLDHPNIVQLYEYYIQGDSVYLVTSLLQGGELLDAVLTCGSYSEQTARQCFRQVLEGIEYLHANGIAHRDLKLENLLLKRHGDITQICIVDFGLAKRDITHAMQMDTVCGTPQFVAPEVISGKKATMYGLAVDMWSAGVILYILLSGDPPFYHKDEKQLFNLIRKGAFSFQDPVWDLISEKAKDFITHMLVVDPQERLTASQALKHPWMCADLREHGYELAGTRENMREMRSKMKAAVATIMGARRLSITARDVESGAVPRQSTFLGDRARFAQALEAASRVSSLENAPSVATTASVQAVDLHS